MRRGQRKIWIRIAEAAASVAASTNYAEEYIGGVEFTNAMADLLATIDDCEAVVSELDPKRPAAGGGGQT